MFTKLLNHLSLTQFAFLFFATNILAQTNQLNPTDQFSNYEIISYHKALQNKLESKTIHTKSINLGNYGEYNIDIYQTNLISEEYRLYTNSNGETEETKTKLPTTYKGKIKGDPSSVVSITMNNDFLYGYIKTRTEELYFEPAKTFLKKASSDDIIVYSRDEVIWKKNNSCAAKIQINEIEKTKSKNYQKASLCYRIEMAIASDYSMVEAYGSIEDVQNHAIGVMNNVQNNFDDEFDDELKFSLVSQFISNCNSCDPWTNSIGAITILNSFSGWAETGFNVSHDIATLWTKRNLDNGNTVGIAWISGVCTTAQYNICQDYTSNAAYKRVLQAHEIGHNFSAQHDPGTSLTIMAPTLNLTNSWSQNSKSAFENFYPNRPCLSHDCESDTTPTCSDGIQNGDETDIDCGGTYCYPCDTPVTCNDGLQNGDETGIDCGGSNCDPCIVSYCDVSAKYSKHEYINKVSFAGIVNFSGNDNGYGDYINKNATVSAGENYLLTLEPGFHSSQYNEYWRVWIDYNGDHDFNDEGEIVFEGSSTEAITTKITIPDNTTTKDTRMRISMQWNKYMKSSCEEYNYGEIEDYGIIISNDNVPTCIDGIQNGDETDIDCGGLSCAPCEITSSCDDGIQNGDETGVDCGGSNCIPCPTNYCNMVGQNTSIEYINRISIANLFNESGNDNGYGNYLDLNSTITSGEQYTLELEPGFESSPYKEAWKVWIDYNGDSDFDDENELIFEGESKETIVTSVTIPANITSKTTRLRIAMQWSKLPKSPCTNIKYGEVEEYSISIIASNNLAFSNKIKTNESYSWRIYPNPISDYFWIDDSKQGDLKEYKIISQSGQLLQYETLSSSSITKVPIASIKSGSYFLQVTDNQNKKHMKKLIIIK